ncbi:MAG: LamG domain-containing protein [Acidobacteria bacterium]|nr:LamG domain-containing protein [Acidobacteriota bacterium]
MRKVKWNVSFWLALGAVALRLAGGTIARAQAEHLAGLWHFDGNLLDNSENGNNGALVGGATFTNNFKFGDAGLAGAINRDGVRGYVDLPNSPSLNITDELTVEAWIKQTSQNGKQSMFIVSKGYYQMAFTLGTVDAPFCFEHSQQPGPHAFLEVITTGYMVRAHEACGATALTLGVWHHLAGTYNAKNGDIKIHVDGVFDGYDNGYGPLNVNDDDVQIGNAPGATAYFHGSVDEVRIWHRVLSPAEVMASAQAGLRADWHFDKNSGTMIADALTARNRFPGR